ncbi:uncharacterized protein DNG_04841 [Cephalotrichum gorgonifer]|uniref:Peptidase A2 domain-containing protein n=1 Tax=Cephalotrichum gorgonifer TaxID=2041049 RepID=A0AAE8MZB3_9PEZI|nr:uncharacterized protein DNG_04841 [Cephalotrichum gorgonifer]
MPVTTRSGLQTSDRLPGPGSRRQQHDQESREPPRKRRRTSRNAEERRPDTGTAAPESPITCGADGADDRPEGARAQAGRPGPETPSIFEKCPPRGAESRVGTFLGRVLGTGRPAMLSPGGSSEIHRPPTPHPSRGLSLPPSMTGERRHRWEPSIVIGRSLGENLSRAEMARRTVRQWEVLYEHTLENTPAAVGPILAQLEHSRRELDELEMNEENITPINNLPSTHQAAISARLSTLRSALSTSECPAESANILGAIRAYESSAIRYWSHWTLIWNGRVVDILPSYESFCADREARLDRYARIHSPGWLWYEAPLSDGGEEAPRAMRATVSVQNRNRWGLGSWNITMGFRRVKSYVSRESKGGVSRVEPTPKAKKGGGAPQSPASKEEEEEEERHHTQQSGAYTKDPARVRSSLTVADDPSAPQLYFDVLLDSGATFPSLYENDLKLMGIDRASYPAQSVVTVTTVGGRIETRLYEIRTTVCTSDGRSLVDASRPVWPAERHELGDIVPVMSIPAAADGAPGARLSGMLPFMASYVSVVPGAKTIWMGEDRRDVLGALKFPGQKRLGVRWDVGGAAELRDEAWHQPAIRFKQRISGDRWLVDRESPREPGASVLGIVNHRGEKLTEYRVEPRQAMMDAAGGLEPPNAPAVGGGAPSASIV